MTKGEIEKLALALCITQNLDPEHVCRGLGGRMLLGSKYSCLDYQVKLLTDAAAHQARPT